MKRFLFLATFALAGVALSFGVASAGSSSGTLDVGDSCQRSSQCKPELRCNLLETNNVADYDLNNTGELFDTASTVHGTCIGARQSAGDDCNNFDCNRRIGLICNPSSTATAFSGGFDYGECRKGSSEDVQKTWRAQCFDKFPNQEDRNKCSAIEDETCVSDGECKYKDLTGLICNTGKTNLGGIGVSGRSGACTLPQAAGGDCEEDPDCRSGLKCNTGSEKCYDPSGGAAGDGGAGAGSDPGAAGGGLDETGRPNFGLEWFRGPFGDSTVGLRTDTPQAFVGGIVQTVLSVLAVLLIALLVYGGATYMTSAGNEKRVESGKQVITYAIVGIVIVGAAYIIAEFVIRALTAV